MATRSYKDFAATQLIKKNQNTEQLSCGELIYKNFLQ